jgi:hypothetical protein
LDKLQFFRYLQRWATALGSPKGTSIGGSLKDQDSD